MNRNFSTRSLVMASVLTALSVVLTRILSVNLTESMRIGIGPLPLILCGILCGPVLGAMAGLAADLVGIMINLGGASIHFGFTLSSVLTGFLPGLVAFYLLRNNKKNLNLTIVLSILLVYGFVHLVLNSIWLNGLYGTPLNVLLVSRAPKVLVEGVLVGLLLRIAFIKVFSSDRVKVKY